jgi:polyhydroxyalkanoate synthesis regulator phasin
MARMQPTMARFSGSLGDSACGFGAALVGAGALGMLYSTGGRAYIARQRELSMAEPENQTLRILREIREAIKAMDEKNDKRFGAVESRLDNIRHALNGESILGRYAVAEVDERLAALEKRVKALEGRR